jgi:hypothetical protein
VDIEMEFEAIDPPGGIMRLIEQYTTKFMLDCGKECEEALLCEARMKIYIADKAQKNAASRYKN